MTLPYQCRRMRIAISQKYGEKINPIGKIKPGQTQRRRSIARGVPSKMALNVSAAERVHCSWI